jgi:hypothetical protein
LAAADSHLLEVEGRAVIHAADEPDEVLAPTAPGAQKDRIGLAGNVTRAQEVIIGNGQPASGLLRRCIGIAFADAVHVRAVDVVLSAGPITSDRYSRRTAKAERVMCLVQS